MSEVPLSTPHLPHGRCGVDGRGNDQTPGLTSAPCFAIKRSGIIESGSMVQWFQGWLDEGFSGS